MYTSLKQLVTGQISANEVTGPVGMVTLVSESTTKGLWYFAYLVALISLNLAIINMRGADEEKLEQVASFYDYLEIQPLINNHFRIDDGTVADEEGLKNINRKIIALADKLGKPVVATTDAHYDEPESAIYRNILMKSGLQ